MPRPTRRTSTDSTSDAPAERRKLERHVAAVQSRIRTCEGCGVCCTAEFNSVTILEIEARRIRAHLQSLPEARRRDLDARIAATIRRYGLEDATGKSKKRYTCAFLEPDMSCALPFDVKPIACLAFNPLTPDACDMEADRFHRAHDRVERENEDAGCPPGRLPIPVAVRGASRDRRPGTR